MFFLWLEIRVTMCVHIPNHAMGTIFLILLKNFVNSNKMLFSRENVIFEIFISTTFVFKRDEVHGMKKVCGCLFRFLLSEMKLLILASILAFILCCDTRHQMVSHWRFCFLKSHLQILPSWVACCKAAFTCCSCVIISSITLWITLFFWSISLSRFAPLRVFFLKKCRCHCGN